MKITPQELEDSSVNFNYSFSSCLGPMEHSRYITEVFQKITLEDGYGKELQVIGGINFLIIHIDHAAESPYGVFEVLDAHSEYVARHVFNVIDAENCDFTDEVMEKYQDFFSRNLCLIKEVTINPNFRGYGLGPKAIKDLTFHFSSSCGLFLIQPFPLQFEAGLERKEKYKGLALDGFEKDKKKAQRKLTSYYKSMGFESIKGIKDLLFYKSSFLKASLQIRPKSPD